MEVGTVIALGSLALAAASLVIAKAGQKSNRPHLVVSTSTAVPINLPGFEDVTRSVLIQAKNDGARQEVVKDLGFEIGDRHLTVGTTWQGLAQLPKVLDPGHSVEILVPFEQVRDKWRDSRLGPMTGVYADCASGRRYRGAPNRFIRDYVMGLAD